MDEQSCTDLKALGEEVARIRTRRELSRTELQRRIDRELFADDYKGRALGDKWLYRLESGELVILSRQVFNALVKALKCTDEELARLYLLGDRNVVVITPGIVTKLKERFNLLMFGLVDDVFEIVESQVGSQLIPNLSPAEVDDLLCAAIELVIADRRSPSR